MSNQPKKVLKIARLIFVLPDDFDGDLHNAIEELAQYLSECMDESKKDMEKNRFAMEYGIFEVDDDEYKLMI